MWPVVPQHTNELDSAEFDGRANSWNAITSANDCSNQDARRKQAAVPGSHDAIARRNLCGWRQIFQPRLAGIVAGQDRPLARVLDQHRNPRIEIGKQQHATGSMPGFDDPTNQTLFRHHRLTFADSVAGTGVKQHGPDVWAAGVADHPGSDGFVSSVLTDGEQATQSRILLLEPKRDLLPMQKPRIVVPQPRVVSVQEHQIFKGGHTLLNGVNRTGQKLQDRRGDIYDNRAQTFGQRQIGLADDEKPDRGRN